MSTKDFYKDLLENHFDMKVVKTRMSDYDLYIMTMEDGSAYFVGDKDTAYKAACKIATEEAEADICGTRLLEWLDDWGYIGLSEDFYNYLMRYFDGDEAIEDCETFEDIISEMGGSLSDLGYEYDEIRYDIGDYVDYNAIGECLVDDEGIEYYLCEGRDSINLEDDIYAYKCHL